MSSDGPVAITSGWSIRPRVEGIGSTGDAGRHRRSMHDSGSARGETPWGDSTKFTGREVAATRQKYPQHSTNLAQCENVWVGPLAVMLGERSVALYATVVRKVSRHCGSACQRMSSSSRRIYFWCTSEEVPARIVLTSERSELRDEAPSIERQISALAPREHRPAPDWYAIANHRYQHYVGLSCSDR